MIREQGACRIIENTWITMRDGCRLAARIWLPDGACERPVPAILEYLPYRKRDATSRRDEIVHGAFARSGYACVRVDIRGNGDSDGLMEDEYTPSELNDGVAIIHWIAEQPWCSGKVGVIGISWGGFNALQLAALAPEPLEAVVTVCSTDDRYADDVHFKGGCLLNDNLTWSQQMLSYSSRPPDPEIVGERWRDLWLHRLENMPLLAPNWLRHQRRDAFWKHGSICEDFAAVRASVLAVGGWTDAYSNAVPRLVMGLGSRCRGIIGPWEHKYPHLAEVGDPTDFLAEALRWWDRWLKGMENGVEEDPAMRVFVLESQPPLRRSGPRAGRWVAVDRWPPPGIETMALHLGERCLTARRPESAAVQIGTPQHYGATAGAFCPGMRTDEELPDDQREDDGLGVCFDGEPLTEPLLIFGAPVVEIAVRSDRPVAKLVARLCDVRPDGSSALVVWAPLNLTHDHRHETATALDPDRWTGIRLVLDEIAYEVPAGHRLRLVLSTTYWPMLWPSPQPVVLTARLGDSRLVLPLASGVSTVIARLDPVPWPGLRPAPGFAEPQRETTEPVRGTRRGERAADGTIVTEIRDDLGRVFNPATGLGTESSVCQRYEIRPSDPLSARLQARWTQRIERTGWRVVTESVTSMHADEQAFHLSARLEAYENDALVFERAWKEAIPRDHQ